MPVDEAVRRTSDRPFSRYPVVDGGLDDVVGFVHHETTFDHEEVRRHLTALLLTPSRLVIAHTDGFWEASVDNGSGVAAVPSDPPIEFAPALTS